MPRSAKGPRLLFVRRRDAADTWVIRDDVAGRRVQRATGCADRRGAEEALAAYIASKTPDLGRRRDPAQILITDVLAVYAAERGPQLVGAGAETLGYCLQALTPFWAGRVCADVDRATCEAYAAQRGVSPDTVRRELSVLTAALRWAVAGGNMTYAPTVTMPAKPPAQERWLTRAEAARLLAAARREPHLATFIRLGLRTGTRPGALLALQWARNPVGGWVDLDHARLYRTAERERQTKKRKPPARLTPALVRHLRAVRRRTRTHVIEYEGRPIASLKTAWRAAVARAGLDAGVTPHKLRHTAITWAMIGGADIYEASGFFGVDVTTMFRVYAHHHPDFGASVLKALR